jgi:hypothetical protein
VTNYHGRVAAIVYNAIDCLTGGGIKALHDNPLAVIGRPGGCYSGVLKCTPTASRHARCQPPSTAARGRGSLTLGSSATFAFRGRRGTRILAVSRLGSGPASRQCPR